MSRDEVSERLGVEGRDSADVVIFKRTVERSGKLTNGEEQQATLSATFTVWFQDDRVARFTGGRVDGTL